VFVNNVNMQSVIKAGAIGAVINIVLGLLSFATLAIPALNVATAVLACCGGLLIPVIAGALYGYFTPGRETPGQAAIGGAIAGFAAGLMYGIFNGLATAAYNIYNGVEIADAVLGSTTQIFGYCCGAILFGSLLGAVGGAIWAATQGNKA
jgi:hypothetical protein